MRTAVIAIVALAGLGRAATARADEPPAPEPAPPAPVVRAVPPGMEKIAAARAQRDAPKAPSYWRDGLTLRVGVGLGSQIGSDGDQIDRSDSSTASFAIGGYPTRRLALLFQFETTAADDAELTYDDLGFSALAADFFVTDRIVLGAALGQATARVLSYTSGNPYGSYDDHATVGVQGRASFLLTQRRKHAVDLDGTVTTRRFDRTQITTVEVSVAYRFL